ncbi:LysR family transcriptional regulator [Nocardia sp. NBC_01329]|uniref:LysR family transcriptional regulator n=1 Tax=Nocardia sp. NBC_01329 TaxID=2903594 RepID=UPI002E1455E2|nr:LysR family transcriptional regulator [Nocardia sp. NBC_01329]
MEQSEIRLFLTLAEELHFARTAERLHLSPGRVSQLVKKLERRFGAELFERSSRRVVLTEFGQRFYAELKPGYDQIQQAVRNATAAGSAVGGRLGIAFSGPWSARLAIRAADAFQTEYPHCEVDIRETSLADSHGLLMSGDVDVQLSELPTDVPGITTGPVLFSEPTALLVPAQHRLATLESAGLDDLADTPLLTFSSLPPAFRELHYPLTTPQGTRLTHLAITMSYAEALLFISEGKGVTIVADRVRHYQTHPDVTYVPLRDGPPIDYGPLWSTARDTPAVREFVRILLSHIPAHGAVRGSAP